MIPDINPADGPDIVDIPEHALTASEIDVDNSVDLLCTAGSLRLQVLLPPRPPPELLLVTFTEAVICILRANVQWMLDLPVINNFTASEQVLILKKCWSRLVLLSLGMFGAQLSLDAVLPVIQEQLQQVGMQQTVRAAIRLRLERELSGEEVQLAAQVIPRDDREYEAMIRILIVWIQNTARLMQQYVRMFEEFDISQPEFAYLRVYSLFVSVNLPNRLALDVTRYKQEAYNSLEAEYGDDIDRITELKIILDYVADITEYPLPLEFIILLPHIHEKCMFNIIEDLMETEHRRRNK